MATEPARRDPSFLPSDYSPLRLPVYSRVMLGQYLWHINVVFLAVLGVVTAINISSEILTVWAEGALEGTFAAVSRSGHYVFLRLLDNGSQVFPIALVLGIAWTEIAHSQSGRRTMVRTAGMPLRKASSALIIIVSISIPFQYVLDNIVRPYAFMSLSVNGLGEYGWSYSRMREERMEWLAFGDDILQARIKDAPDPLLSEVTHYRFSRDGELSLLSDASFMARNTEGGDESWTFVDGRQWALSRPGSNGHEGERSTRLVAKGSFEVDLKLDPLWLDYRHIAARYIPLGDLLSLSRQTALPDNAPRYREWLHIRAAKALNPGLLALLIATVFAVFVDRLGLARAGAAMIVAGYAGLTLTRVMAVVAEHQVLPLALSVWTPPLLLLLASVILFHHVRLRDRRFEEAARVIGGSN